MAAEHTLKLKAVLDTSDVQNKLQQINKNVNGSSGANGTGPSAANLNNVLSRLNQSITALNRSIAKLGTATQKQTTAVSTVGKSTSSVVAAPVAGGHVGSIGASFKAWQNNRLKQEFSKLRWSRDQYSFVTNPLISRASIDPTIKLYRDMLQTGTRQMTFGSHTLDLPAFPEYKQFKAYQRSLRSGIDPVFRRTLGYGIGAMGIGGLVNSAQGMVGPDDYTSYFGHNVRTSTALGAVGNIGQGAMMGAMLGPWGAVGGAALAGLQSALELWIDALKESEKELEKWNNSVKEAAKFRKVRSQYAQNRDIDIAVETSDTSKLKTIYSDLTTRAMQLEKLLEGADRTAKSGEVASNALEWQQELEQIQAKLKSINSSLEQIDEKKKREAELNEKLNGTIADSRSGIKQFDISRANSRLIEGLNINKYRLPWEDGPTAAEHDKDFATTYAKYRQHQQQAAADRKRYEDLLAQAEAETDPAKKTKLIEQAQRARGDWQWNVQQQDLFKGAMKDVDLSRLNTLQNKLSNMVTPDLSNTQSMASIGANMGEKNDNIQRQQSFWNETLDLQRQMKDLLDLINQNYGATYQ